MRILNLKKYKDGGTIEIITDELSYYLDNRISSITKNKLYVGYPKNDNSNLIIGSTPNLIKDLLEALIIHRTELGLDEFTKYYQTDLDYAIEILEGLK